MGAKRHHRTTDGSTDQRLPRHYPPTPLVGQRRGRAGTRSGKAPRGPTEWRPLEIVSSVCQNSTIFSKQPLLEGTQTTPQYASSLLAPGYPSGAVLSLLCVCVCAVAGGLYARESWAVRAPSRIRWAPSSCQVPASGSGTRVRLETKGPQKSQRVEKSGGRICFKTKACTRAGHCCLAQRPLPHAECQFGPD